MKFKWYDFITCAIGKHFWGGWSMTSGGKYSSEYWCLRCKVVRHDERNDW